VHRKTTIRIVRPVGRFGARAMVSHSHKGYGARRSSLPAVDVIVLADDVAGVEAEVEGESCVIPSGTAREGGLDPPGGRR